MWFASAGVDAAAHALSYRPPWYLEAPYFASYCVCGIVSGVMFVMSTVCGNWNSIAWGVKVELCLERKRELK